MTTLPSPEVVRKCDELLQMLRSSRVKVPRRYWGRYWEK